MEKALKRKTIEIPDNIFNKLSVLAATKGESIKKFIENLLISTAQGIEVTVTEKGKDDTILNSMSDDDAYRYLSTKYPEGLEAVSKDEQKELEKLLGLK